ncbi:hypothetical protein BB561_004274 [Smittium simulii]|uniref:CCHC-type domain-containing protein n=1 Tax=Smittium simulii TaxID=133385 RepID=A0A2T9YH45_9FUNG|nr:hypothetical protein BB561_004274 [Smittium simulii]
MNQNLAEIISAAVAAALSQQSGTSGQTLTLPEYYGLGSPISFKSWFNKCIDLFEAFAIRDESRRVANMKLQFRGTAETELSNYIAKDNSTKLTTTKLFYDNLAPLFIDPSYPQVLRRKLQMLKQTGSLAEYISIEANLMGDYKDITDAERIYLFKYGLDNKFVDILNLKNPATFLEAISLISKHGTAIDMRLAQENIQDSMAMDVDNITINQIVNKKENVNFTLLNDCYAADTFLYSINGTEVPINVSGRVGRTYLNNNLVCWNCGVPGHRRADCNKLPMEYNNRSQFSRGGNRGWNKNYKGSTRNQNNYQRRNNYYGNEYAGNSSNSGNGPNQ